MIAGVTGCIDNNVPLPTLVPSLSNNDFEAEGISDFTINAVQRTITMVLNEETDIHAVNITKCNFKLVDARLESEQIVYSRPVVGVHDLSKDFVFTLSVYQDYKWTIKATQTIERHISFTGQVGSAFIDAQNCRIVADVTKSISLHDVAVKSIKLGPADITKYTPALEQLKDFSSEKKIWVKYNTTEQEWTVVVNKTDATVKLNYAEPWTRIVWLSASGMADEKNGFCIRRSGDSEWTDISGEQLITDGGSFSIGYDKVEPNTKYECYAYSGSDITPTMEFETDIEKQLPNASFEVVSHAENKKFYSFYDPESSNEELQQKWWDSGNVASAKYGYEICRPDQSDFRHGKQSACLETSYAVVKLAAGNLFAGEFEGLDGLDGKVNFGRYWSLRPRAVRFWCKYKGGKVNYPKTHYTTDDYDECELKFALGTWDNKLYGGTKECPVQVNTAKESTFWDMSSIEGTIAWANKIIKGDGNTGEWQQVTLPLDYYDILTKPTHMIISFAASRYGDYYEGSSSSVLWIDSVELLY